MNIHEYQGKSILKSFGVGIQEGIVADTPEQAVEAAKELTKTTGTNWWVIKAQIHAGVASSYWLSVNTLTSEPSARITHISP